MTSQEAPPKVGPDFLNEILHEAEVTEVRFTKNAQGALWLDTRLSSPEVIDKLVNGLSLLYVKLLRARRERR